MFRYAKMVSQLTGLRAKGQINNNLFHFCQQSTINIIPTGFVNIFPAQGRLGDIPPWNVPRNVPAGIDWY
jgi:hypothetical protein